MKFPEKLNLLLPGIILLIGCLNCFSQSPRASIQKADRFFQRKDYANALQLYRDALTIAPDDPRTNFKAGVSCLNEQFFGDALAYLERAHQLNSEVDPQINYHLATAYQENHQFARALEHFKIFREKYKSVAGVANQKIAECALADSLMRINAGASVTTMTELNTPFSEFSPVVSRDGKKMIFTSNRSNDDFRIKSATNFGDVYLSERSGDQWSEPKKIAPEINVDLHEAAVAISPDGRTLFLYYEEGEGDIYTSTWDGSKWSAPVALNRFVNHPQYRESSACLSPDGKRLFFSSNRPGGKGGYDIYVCKLGTNGQWGRPSNLGSPINTRGDEEFPFVHADSVTLYFSSNGHATLGSHDIFKTTKLDGHWSPPMHLGYPINTRAYEGGFVLSDDKKTGYFFSRRGNPPDNADLFKATFHNTEDESPTTTALTGSGDTPSKNVVTLLKGKVIDAEANSPLTATVSLVDNTLNEEVASVRTDTSGNFRINIPYKGNFGLRTAKTGYLFNSMNFNLPPFEKYQEIDTHILMVRAEVGSKIILKNIFFDVNQSELKKESLSELENIRDILQENPQWRIRINGHTDNLGHPKTNMRLSQARAQSVVQYLISEGISPDRLEAKGFGAERPLVSNDDENEGRQINRRTEIEIIE